MSPLINKFIYDNICVKNFINILAQTLNLRILIIGRYDSIIHKLTELYYNTGYNIYNYNCKFDKINIKTNDFFEKTVLSRKKNVIIVAHGNSLRATMIHTGLYKPEDISNIELPTGSPFCIVFTDNKLEDSFYFS